MSMTDTYDPNCIIGASGSHRDLNLRWYLHRLNMWWYLHHLSDCTRYLHRLRDLHRHRIRILQNLNHGRWRSMEPRLRWF